MGTNYYLRIDQCGHCGRHNEIHVGKSSAGWSFGFRAWPHRLMDSQHPDWGYEPSSPFGFSVLSRAGWRKAFTTVVGELFDEYGVQVDDPLAWLDSLPAPDRVKQRWEDNNRGPYRRGDDREWRDAEGFRFYAGEFS